MENIRSRKRMNKLRGFIFTCEGTTLFLESKLKTNLLVMSAPPTANNGVFAPVAFAMEKIGGKWKMPILWRLNKTTLRYSELKRELPEISDKVITAQLRELEADGFIFRKVYPVVPPKTEYSLTEKGKSLIALIRQFRAYGVWMMKGESAALNAEKQNAARVI